MIECTIHTRTQIKSVASLLACKIYYNSTAEVSILFFPCHCCFSWLFIIICIFFNPSVLVVAPLCCLNQGPSILFPPRNFHASKLGGSAQSKRHQLKAKMPLLRICSKQDSARQWHSAFFGICNLVREFRSHVLVGVTNSSPLKLGRAPKGN